MTFKTNLHAQFAVDLSKEESGVWTPFGGGVELCIRRLSSEASQKARTEAEKPYLTRSRNAELSSDDLEAIAIKQLAFGIIADWKGVKVPAPANADGSPAVDEKGNPLQVELPFSAQAAFEILNDEEMKDLRGAVLQVSVDRDAFKKEADKDAVKN